MEGIKFQLLDENKNFLEELITDKNGEAISRKYPSLYFGDTFYIREIRTLEDYILNDTDVKVTLKEEQITNYIFENDIKKGQIKVVKIDKDNHERPVADSEFAVKDITINKIVDTIKTDEQGFATTIYLRVDHEYELTEISTNYKYNINTDTFKATVKGDQITKVEIENELKKEQLKIIKIDLDDNEVKLPGVVFEILDKDLNVIEELTTDENAEAVSSNLPCVDEVYYAREKETLEMYVLSDEVKEIVLEENQIKNIVFENEKIKGYIEITKLDENTKEKVNGATFGVYNSDDEQVDIIVIENGVGTSNLCLKGVYKLKELETGNLYYLLNENEYFVEIKEHLETVKIDIENTPVEIAVDVEKNGDTETKPNELIEYKFKNVANTSNIYLQSFKWIDYLPYEYTKIETLETGTWNQDLYYDVYYKTTLGKEVLFAEKLHTTENYTLDFINIELEENEEITQFYFDFCKVDVEFKEDISPRLFCRTKEDVTDKTIIENYTETVGNYYDMIAKARCKWKTITRIPKVPEQPILPKTGR